jgi:exopolyphosphatase / guanosine-5'-triphosphate,3'-diphosphate pyrophosphatase
MLIEHYPGGEFNQMISERVASIDLGTNTARLLIGTTGNGKVERHFISRRITRLGGGFTKDNGISQDAAIRTISAMKDFAITLKEYRVEKIRAVATSAVRDAVNSSEFCNKVRSASGIELEVISGELEGKLTLSGVISGLDIVPGSLFVFDVGGGSTEYTVSSGENILFTRSLPLGVVRLTEGKVRIDAMAEKVEKELHRLFKELQSSSLIGRLSSSTLVGTAGTATTLAAISLKLTDYDYRKVNNHLLSLDEIKLIYSALLPLSPDERLRQITGLEEGREDLIIAGTLLTIKTMELFGFSTLKVSDYGLLEGVLLDLANREDSNQL